VGGYSDWAKVSKAAKAARLESEQPKKQPKAKPKPAAKRRLSYKENKELEALPLRIEELETEQADLNEQLGDPKLYQEAPEKVKTIRQRQGTLEEELATCYSRWEELDSIG